MEGKRILVLTIVVVVLLIQFSGISARKRGPGKSGTKRRTVAEPEETSLAETLDNFLALVLQYLTELVVAVLDCTSKWRVQLLW